MSANARAARSVIAVLGLIASGCDRYESQLGIELRRVERAAKRGDLVEVANTVPGVPLQVQGEKRERMRVRIESEMARIVAENYDALSATMLDGGTLRSGTGYFNEIVPTPEMVDRIIGLMEGSSAQRPEVAARWPQLKAALEQARDKYTAEHETKARNEVESDDNTVRDRVLFVTREADSNFERLSCLEQLRLDLPSTSWLIFHNAPSTHEKELAAAVVTLYEKPKWTTHTVTKDTVMSFGRGGRALRALKALTGADQVEVGTITGLNLEVTVTTSKAQRRSARWDVPLPEPLQPSFRPNDPEDQSRALTELWREQCAWLTAELKLVPAQ